MRWTLGLVLAPMALQPASAADVGRYQIAPGPPMILLDTATGKSWRYEAEGAWLPLAVTQAAEPAPKPKISTQERWKRDTEARRLQLLKSRKSPAGPPK